MTRTLRKGHRGPDVKRWQLFLAARGLQSGARDAIFDDATDAATRSFQEKHGLKSDGIVGPKTLTEAAKLGFRAARRLTNAELTPGLIAHARTILRSHHTAEFGTEVPFELDGIRYFGRIEEHFHPPGGPLKPWGHHPGVSLFIDTPFDNVIVAPDEVTDPAQPEVADSDDSPVIATAGTIVIDPGHGGSATVGSSSANNARSASGVLEKDLTLMLAKLVRASLVKRSALARVELTRNEDLNLDLAERAKVARRLRADLFLSIHFNGFDKATRGTEVLVRPKASGNVNHADDQRFAGRVLAAVHGAIKELDPQTRNRGVKDQVLGVLRDDFLGNTLANHPCRACLLEVEFLDVPAVDALFNTGPNAEHARIKVADAIASALLEELAG